MNLQNYRKMKRFINVQIMTTIVQKMTTILKPGIKKILHIFYEHKDRRIYLLELARLTNLYGQSVTRYLNQLEEGNILKFEREGNLKKYSIRKNNETYSIFAYFDIENYDSLPQIKKTAIELFLDELEEQPIIAFLFGSTAKKSFKKDSDIDLFLITNKKINTEKAIYHVDAQTAQRISAFQITLRDFKKELKIKEDH